MKTTNKDLKFTSLLLLLFFSLIGFSQSSARYTITFNGSWNSSDHGTLPGNAHWSDLVGATHNSTISFWESGSLASAGIEDVAEIGNNTAFNSEVDTAISNGNADQWLREGFSPNVALGTCLIMDVIVTEDHPLLTLVSMIAPSPDWFVGVNDISLLDGSNNWKNNITIDMFPYDAGTEDGTNYSTSNTASNPLQNIFSRINMTPFNDQKVGTLTIQLEELLSLDSQSIDNDLIISPNPATDHITILNNKSNIQSITIYNMIGNLVSSIDDQFFGSTIKISRNGLNSGLYVMNFKFLNGDTLIRKIIFK